MTEKKKQKELKEWKKELKGWMKKSKEWKSFCKEGEGLQDAPQGGLQGDSLHSD